MLTTILISVVIVAVAVLLLGVKVFFVKGGKFPGLHISGNKEMQKKGITCAVSTDARDRARKTLDDVVKQNQIK
ncbi:MAG: hypothetical protein IJ442_05875 [Bacteroidaceae bacterium]|nr:hypothetical protein [Bacteroidaceae bacterium]